MEQYEFKVGDVIVIPVRGGKPNRTISYELSEVRGADHIMWAIAKHGYSTDNPILSVARKGMVCFVTKNFDICRLIGLKVVKILTRSIVCEPIHGDNADLMKYYLSY